MDMERLTAAFMAWYGGTFKTVISPQLTEAGFGSNRVKTWGFGLFRRPVRSVLTSVGMKAKKDTEDIIGVAVFATVLAACLTMGICGLHVASFVSLAGAFLVMWMALTLIRMSFREDISLCEIGMKVYTGMEGRFIRRYSVPLVLLAVSEASKKAGDFKGKSDCDEFMSFVGKLQTFGGFTDEEKTGSEA